MWFELKRYYCFNKNYSKHFAVVHDQRNVWQNVLQVKRNC